jgi:hypothetical protein
MCRAIHNPDDPAFDHMLQFDQDPQKERAHFGTLAICPHTLSTFLLSPIPSDQLPESRQGYREDVVYEEL